MSTSISAVIPVFNRVSTLSRTLDAILGQTIALKEVIVVDDGSTDNLIEFMSKNYPEVTVLRQENQGVSAARNKGIKKARGDWIAFCDSDDVWKKDKCEKQLENLNNNPSFKLCHTNEIWIRQGKEKSQQKRLMKKEGEIFQDCLETCIIATSSVLIYRKVFEEIGLFDESLAVCEDYDLWLRFTSRFPVLLCPENLVVKYDGHPDQLSHKVGGLQSYRIQSLEKIAKSTFLSDKDLLSIRKMLKHKLEVFLLGARKHQNPQLKAYEEKLKQVSELSLL